MCMMVYVASDQPLPTPAWDPNRPAFHAEPLSEEEQATRRWFSKRFAYYVGPHTGCGCGFQCHEEVPLGPDTPADVVANAHKDAAERLEARRQLSEYLEEALVGEDSVELLACWAGCEGEVPQHRETIRPRDIVTTRLRFREEGELLLVVRP